MMTKIRSRSDILSKEFLEECFEANFEEGVLIWKVRPLSHFESEKLWKIWNTKYAGKVAGSNSYKTNTYSFRRVTLCKKYFPEHHILWTMYKGEMIDTTIEEIDHVDRNPFNNSISNLRKVSRSQNVWNTCGRVSRPTTSRYKGVCYDESRRKWMLQFACGTFSLKQRFDKEKEAAYLYKILSDEYHSEMSSDIVQCVEMPYDFSISCIKPKLKAVLLSLKDDVKIKHKEFFNMLLNNSPSGL